MAQLSSDSKDVGVQSAFERFDGDGYNQIEAKYLGSTVDQREMNALGRIQQLRVCDYKDKNYIHCLTNHKQRNFQYISVLGFGCTLIGTWEFALGCALTGDVEGTNVCANCCPRFIQFGLTNGGTAGLIYGFIIVFFGFLACYLSIAEMASM